MTDGRREDKVECRIQRYQQLSRAMIDDPEHPELIAAAEELRQAAVTLCVGRVISRQLLEQVIEMRDDHRTRWRLRGVDFPYMVIFCIPRVGMIDFWRADLDPAGIRTKIINLISDPTRRRLPVSAQEVAQAIHAAYPDLGGIDALADESGQVRVRRATIQ